METRTFIGLKNIIDKHEKHLKDNKTKFYGKITHIFMNNNFFSIKDCYLLLNYIFFQKDFVSDFHVDYKKISKDKNSYTLFKENRKVINLVLYDYDKKDYNELKKYFIKHKNDLYVISIKLKGSFMDKNIDLFLHLCTFKTPY